MTTEYAARYTNTVLYDDAGLKHLGDFLIHDNGAWSVSNGDEDVRYVSTVQTNYSHARYKIGILT